MLLQMSQRGYVISHSSPQCTLGFSLGVVHPVGFRQCVITRTRHRCVARGNFSALKILWAQRLYPAPPSPRHHVSLVLPFPNAVPRHWSHTACGLRRLASPAQRPAFKVLPRLFRARWLVSSHCWVTVHCLGGAHLCLHHLLEGVLLARAPLPCPLAMGVCPVGPPQGPAPMAGVLLHSPPLSLFLPSRHLTAQLRPVLRPFMH